MKTGFTLMEIIVVVIIIGILATLALPAYTPIRERTLAREAQANLRLIAAAERIYLMEGASYYPFTWGTNVSNLTWINNNLSLFITSGNWDYEIRAPIFGGGFTAFAYRKPGWGAYSTCTYMINETSNDPIVYSGNCP